MENNIVRVMLWGNEVGLLYWSHQQHRAVFEYNKDFLQKGIDIAPLTASIYNPISKKSILGDKDKLYQGLPPFIADSLPDFWGNLVFESWAKEQGLSTKQITPVDKLSFIGSRAMGALEFQPAYSLQQIDEDIQLSSLYNLAKRIFDERSEISVFPEESLTLQSLYTIGTSAGGKHPKAIIAINNNTKEIKSGQIDLPKDFTNYILKFSETDSIPYTEIEYSYYLMAKECGINIMPSKLICIDNKNHFLTERYDRINGERIHTQTLAAMDTVATSYEDLMSCARKLGVSSQDIEQLFIRILFNIWAGNVDDHTKNFSFMLQKNKKWSITPAYDLTFTMSIDGPKYENRHYLSLRGKVSDFNYQDLLQFAVENDIKDATNTMQKVASIISNCRQYLIKAGVPDYWTNQIEKSIKKLILF